MSRSRISLVTAAAASLLAGVTAARSVAAAKAKSSANTKADANAAANAVPDDAGAPLDLGDAKDKLTVLTDGKQHYVAVIPFGEIGEHLYYGDGKVFWAQRVIGGGSSGKESFDRVFWDPRMESLAKSSFELRNGKYVMQCDERRTELQPLPDAEKTAMLADAKFYAARWKHRAYSLSRDNKGKYYYVDKVREPESSKSFRLFAGMKGNLKQQKMLNVVSDSQGDIFSTKSGSLRLVLGKNESTWIEGNKKITLVTVPVEDNHVLIYTDLGAYSGQRLGTPCDDL